MIDTLQRILYNLLVFGSIGVIGWLAYAAQKRQRGELPLSHVASAALGPVRLCGTVKCRRKLVAPLSGEPCCFWSCQVEEWTTSDSSDYWGELKSIHTDELFFLEESGALVLVDPSSSAVGAVVAVYGSPTYWPLDTSDDRAVLAFLDHLGIKATTLLGFRRKLRVVERVLREGTTVSAAGVLTARHYPGSADPSRGFAQYPAAQAEADRNRDGMITDTEWDAFVVAHSPYAYPPTGELNVLTEVAISTCFSAADEKHQSDAALDALYSEEAVPSGARPVPLRPAAPPGAVNVATITKTHVFGGSSAWTVVLFLLPMAGMFLLVPLTPEDWSHGTSVIGMSVIISLSIAMLILSQWVWTYYFKHYATKRGTWSQTSDRSKERPK